MQMRGLLAAGLAVVLCVGLGSACCAQYGTTLKSGLGYSIDAGALFPLGDGVDGRGILTASWYGPVSEDVGRETAYGLSVEWTSVDRLGTDVDIYPVFLNYRQHGMPAGPNSFVTLGLGVVNAIDEVPEMELDDGLNFAWTAGIGMDFGQKYQAQVRFIGGDDPGDDGMFAVQVGYRF